MGPDELAEARKYLDLLNAAKHDDTELDAADLAMLAFAHAVVDIAVSLRALVDRGVSL